MKLVVMAFVFSVLLVSCTQAPMKETPSAQEVPSVSAQESEAALPAFDESKHHTKIAREDVEAAYLWRATEGIAKFNQGDRQEVELTPELLEEVNRGLKNWLEYLSYDTESYLSDGITGFELVLKGDGISFHATTYTTDPAERSTKTKQISRLLFSFDDELVCIGDQDGYFMGAYGTIESTEALKALLPQQE